MYHYVMVLKHIHLYLSSSGLSPKVIENYGSYLHRFFDWFRTDYPNVDIKKVDASYIDIWLKKFPHWSGATKYQAVAALKGFYRHTFSDSHQVTKMKVHKTDAGPQRTMDQEELTALLSAITVNTPRGIRNLAIITLMADTGMRSGEVCGLDMTNLDMRKGKLNVLVKGGVWNEKVFAEYTASCLQAWLSIRSDYASKGIKNVFVSIGGRTPGKAMTKSGMLFLYDELAKEAGLDHVSPHAMRRTFATLATEQGAPSRLVQVAGGWKSIRMVEHYTQTLKADTIRRYSPVNNLMGLNDNEEKQHIEHRKR